MANCEGGTTRKPSAKLNDHLRLNVGLFGISNSVLASVGMTVGFLGHLQLLKTSGKLRHSQLASSQSGLRHLDYPIARGRGTHANLKHSQRFHNYLFLARECRDRRVTRETCKTRFADWPRRGCAPEPEHKCLTFPLIPSRIKSTYHDSECQGSYSVAHYNVGLLPTARSAIAAPFRCFRRSSYLQLGHRKCEALSRWLRPRVWDLLLEPRTRSQYSSTVVPNGTFPGPTFMVNKGDSVVIHTHNKLTSPDMRRSTSIVWCPPVGCSRHF